MALFREEDRHPNDPRILIIRDKNDFAAIWGKGEKWRHRHSIRGLIYGYPATAEELQRAADELCVFVEKTGGFFNAYRNFYIPRRLRADNEVRIPTKTYLKSKYQISVVSSEDGLEVLKGKNIPLKSYFNHEALSTKTQDILVNLFTIVASIGGEFKDIKSYLGVNNTFPEFFHNHKRDFKANTFLGDTFTFSVAGGGTVCKTGSSEVGGVEYQVEDGELLLVDHTIWHAAAEFDKNISRVNLLFGAERPCFNYLID